MCTICPILEDSRVHAERGYRGAQHCAGAPIRAIATPPPSRQALAEDAPGRAALGAAGGPEPPQRGSAARARWRRAALPWQRCPSRGLRREAATGRRGRLAVGPRREAKGLKQAGVLGAAGVACRRAWG